MCDTLVSLPDHNGGEGVIFAKNSDREPNEAQAIVRVPAHRWKDKHVRCTYIAIPQVSETYEVLLSKPFQMWGAEMGVNEHGVAIGNEAVFTSVRIQRRNNGLSGMDMLRLALERSRDASQALECIIELLADYGQDACGGYENRNFFYHNSFLIADASQAWVLETAGPHWALQQAKGFRSISNALTIEDDYERLSAGTIEYAHHRGWHKKGKTFNFRHAFSNRLYTWLSHSGRRQETTTAGVGCRAGAFSAAGAMSILSTHHPPDKAFDPRKATTHSVCMHATGPLNPSQTTGSMVAELQPDGTHTVWFTGTSMPCLSVYLPFYFGDTTLLPPEWALPSDRADDSLWWRAERLHRLVCREYQAARALFDKERQAFQQSLIEEEKRQSASIRADFSARVLRQYEELLAAWTQWVENAQPNTRGFAPLYHFFRRRIDSRAGLI